MAIPKASAPKEMPEQTINTPVVPKETPLSSTELKEVPKLKITPEQTAPIETVPEPTPEKVEKPSTVIEENCVMIGDEKVEIKPTKLLYFRNKAASAYNIIKAVPLYELLTYGKGVFDENRDADQLLFDFLVSVFDDSIFVRDHYNDLTVDTIDQIVKIIGRINHFDEKEEQARKNREAQAQKR